MSDVNWEHISLWVLLLRRLSHRVRRHCHNTVGRVFKTDDIGQSRELVIGMRDRHVSNTNVAKTMGQ